MIVNYDLITPGGPATASFTQNAAGAGGRQRIPFIEYLPPWHARTFGAVTEAQLRSSNCESLHPYVKVVQSTLLCALHPGTYSQNQLPSYWRHQTSNRKHSGQPLRVALHTATRWWQANQTNDSRKWYKVGLSIYCCINVSERHLSKNCGIKRKHVFIIIKWLWMEVNINEFRWKGTGRGQRRLGCGGVEGEAPQQVMECRRVHASQGFVRLISLQPPATRLCLISISNGSGGNLF